MSATTEATQGEAQASQVELEYRREGKRENKAMDSKLVAPKFKPNLITRVYDDNLSTGSTKSGGDDHKLQDTLFFAHASDRVAAPIGEPILSGEYPQMDNNWDFWITSTPKQSWHPFSQRCPPVHCHGQRLLQISFGRFWTEMEA
jgi:hypothetical protein